MDHTHPQQEPGPEAVIQEAASFREAFPDVWITIELMLAEKDPVAFHFLTPRACGARTKKKNA